MTNKVLQRCSRRCALTWLALVSAQPTRGLAQADAAEQLLPGTWQHRVMVMGEVKVSDWMIAAGGSWLITGYTQHSGFRVDHAPQSGQWSLQNGWLLLQSSGKPPHPERRRIIELTAERFVSVDERFGIEWVCTRLQAPSPL